MRAIKKAKAFEDHLFVEPMASGIRCYIFFKASRSSYLLLAKNLPKRHTGLKIADEHCNACTPELTAWIEIL